LQVLVKAEEPGDGEELLVSEYLEDFVVRVGLALLNDLLVVAQFFNLFMESELESLLLAALDPHLLELDHIVREVLMVHLPLPVARDVVVELSVAFVEVGSEVDRFS